MKRFFLTFIAAMAASVALSQAQTTEDYLKRYNTLVARVGAAGVGVDFLLESWEKADPMDINHMVGRFSYYLAKAHRDSVVTSGKQSYMGLEPLVSLKDSLGRNIYYYRLPVYAPTDFARAMEAIDNAITTDNTRLDLMLSKAEALVAYEGAYPKQSEEYLSALVQNHFTRKSRWTVPGVESVSDADFLSEMSNFCYIWFNADSDQAKESFRRLSEKILKFRPKETTFINNIGSYYASKKDDKKALKYYRNTLKIDPNDVVALQNIKLIERRAANQKKK